MKPAVELQSTRQKSLFNIIPGNDFQMKCVSHNDEGGGRGVV